MLKLSFIWRSAALLSLALSCACATIPEGRYGVERLNFQGVDALSSGALRACIVTEQREKLTLGLGALASPTCGEPPFDRQRWSARLFALPWTDWPLYNEAVFKLDLDRIERWYQARGYYGARILDVNFAPSDARAKESCTVEDCSLDITVEIEEGDPVLIRELVIHGDGKELEPELHAALLAAVAMDEGDRFDEALYDRARERMANVLRERGYARAAIIGDVVINRGLLVADVDINVIPGAVCHVSEVRIVGNPDVPTDVVLAAAGLEEGQIYSPTLLQDAQAAIYGLGAFSAVSVSGRLDEGSGPDIPVEIDLEPRRQSTVMVGAGIQAGTAASGVAAEEAISLPQWDVHLFGSYENRNFFGGLRRFHIEERPRLLFLSPFPGVPDDSPHFGNTITADFSQPGVIDARTKLFLETRWDNGPDPFLLFFRHDVSVAIGLQRAFWHQRISARVSVHQDIMQVANNQPLREKINEEQIKQAGGDPPPNCGGLESVEPDCLTQRYLIPSSYRLFFVEQRLSLDLRDDATKPTEGAYFRISIHEAMRVWDPSWNYIRLTPEARGYAPVGLGMVLAARFALGSLHILDRSKELDQQAQRLGPQSYRLRGGGANSVRGFAPGELGDGLAGGTRRWEGSLELRVPLSRDFWIVGFGDVGDVYTGYKQVGMQLVEDKHFRFTHLNTSVGAGLRYYTIIGPIRLDVAGRPDALQWKSNSNATMNLGFTKFEGAVHLTIGDSF